MPWQLAGRKVAVVGLGKTGVAVARFCCTRGAQVVGCDDRDEKALSGALSELAPFLSAGCLTLCLGGISAQALCASSLVLCSPGVQPNHPALTAARNQGLEIVGEIEFASRFVRAQVVGITGTNGKSTVTSLCGAIAQQTGRPCFCGGNLGTPLIDAVDTPATLEGGIVVLELSSFQLETCRSLQCHAAAVLNVTADHLDRYPSMHEYAEAKARIFHNLPAAATRVVDGDDPQVRALCARLVRPGDRVLWFGSAPPPEPNAGFGWVKNGHLVLSWPGLPNTPATEERYALADFQLVGGHNQKNLLAAFLLMRGSGLATRQQVQRAAAAFVALPHRMQRVGEKQGVAFFDDSKGTNVDAVVAGLTGFPQPFVLIAGGRHKGGSYLPLRQVLCQQTTRGVVLIGEAAPLIAKALVDCPFPVQHAKTLEQAVAQSVSLCEPGDAVVLSPACSSYDMFTDYAERARVFCAAVRDLPQTGLTAQSPKAAS